MLQYLRERLTLLLFALLPFHAFLVTAGTRMLSGKGHAPLAYLAIWKETLLGVILVLSVMEAVRATVQGRRTKDEGRREGNVFRRADWIDGLIVALVMLSAFVTVFTHGDLKLALLGFKYDFVPLVAFLVARRVPWSETFLRMVSRVLIGVGVLVAAYGMLTTFLPMQFFLWLGYSPAHSLYFADGPVAAFQQVSDTGLRRVQSTMSGPNQLGLWLLIPFGLLLSLVWATRESSKEKRSAASSPPPGPVPPRRLLQGFGVDSSAGRFAEGPSSSLPVAAGSSRWLLAVCLLLLVSVLFLSFSRSAWIAAFVMLLVSVSGSVPRHLLKRTMLGGTLVVVLLAVVVTLLFPSVFFRLSSSRGHLVRPLQAIGRMVAHPFGEGLGAAGPASNRVSETCVFLRPQDDPSWAKTAPRLCVFLGATQVQPLDHICRCPFLPENWYLQIGVELGFLGFGLFVALVLLILRRLGVESGRRESLDVSIFLFPLSSFLIFLGISIAALFLHAWEDSAVAYTVWLLLAMQLPVRKPR